MRIAKKIIPLVSEFTSLEGSNYHTCAYCLVSEKTALFDAGNPGDVTSQYVDELALNGVRLEDINYALITHMHGDHAGGAFELREFGIPLCLPEAEVQYLENLSLAFDRYFAPVFKALGQEDLVGTVRLSQNMGYIVGPCKVDKPLKDHEIIELGPDVHIEVIPIPGHTDNSVGYLWKEEMALISGDAIQSYGQVAGGLPIINNPLAMERTLHALLDMDLQYLLNGHMFQTSSTHACTANPVKRQKEIDNYFLENLELHHIILDSVNDAAAECGDVPFIEIITPAMDRISKRIPILVDYKKPIQRPYNFPQTWLDTLVAYYFTVKGLINP